MAGASLDVGFVPQFRFLGSTVDLTAWSASARVYPFEGSFFMGARYGRMTDRSTETDALDGNGPASTMESRSYLAPEVGWRWVWDSGLALGLDLGYAFGIERSRVGSGGDLCKLDNVSDATCTTLGWPLLGIHLLK